MLYPQNELIENLSFEAYAAADGINASGLKDILRSPAHYHHAKYVAARKETPALRFGTMVHQAILEPEHFARHAAVRPNVSLRSNQGKDDLAKWRADQGPELIEVTDNEMQTLTGMLTACHRHSKLRRLLQHGKREVSLFYTDPIHEALCKCRYDFVAQGTNIVVDIKTTIDSRADPFARDALKYNYAISVAHYLEGAKISGVANAERFVLVAIEKEAPYGIMLYEMCQDEIERGRQWRHFAMDQYATCARTGIWPSYSEDFQILEGLPWAPQPVEFDLRAKEG